MKYKDFIEENFLIDEPQAGKLVPFKFNKVQTKAYKDLCRDYDIENKGIQAPIREIYLKARREGFSSLILAIFAADDVLNDNPTETQVLSYKDDATKKFRKRYRTYLLTYQAKKNGFTYEQIVTNPDGVLEAVAKAMFSVDSTEIELKHNKAHFFCGTASARTGERGGVLQKLLFSEAAFYPDTENMTAEEMIEGTMRQVDPVSGWIFIESTANGVGNHYERIWNKAEKGLHRFKARFWGWREHYSEKEIKVIKSEFVDEDMFKQEYPETPEEAFKASEQNFVTQHALDALIEFDKAEKDLHGWLKLSGTNYIEQCEIIKHWLFNLEQANQYMNLYVGIDVAKDPDSTVVTVLRHKITFQKGGVRAISIDSTGAGDFMPDWFELNTRWTINKIKFSVMMKDILYKNLQAVIKKRLTALPLIQIEPQVFTSPEAEDFYNQMLYLQKEIRGRLLLAKHPPGKDYHDDFPDSWALAENAYISVHGLPDDKEFQQTQPNPSPISKLLNRGTGSGKIINTGDNE